MGHRLAETLRSAVDDGHAAGPAVEPIRPTAGSDAIDDGDADCVVADGRADGVDALAVARRTAVPAVALVDEWDGDRVAGALSAGVDAALPRALLDTDPDGEPVFAGATILATGGIGDCFKQSTNPPGSTGDGIAMAFLAGAEVDDMEYVQFHPTAADVEEPFLLSEAVRAVDAGAGTLADGIEAVEARPPPVVDGDAATEEMLAGRDRNPIGGIDPVVGALLGQIGKRLVERFG